MWRLYKCFSVGQNPIIVLNIKQLERRRRERASLAGLRFGLFFDARLMRCVDIFCTRVVSAFSWSSVTVKHDPDGH